MVTILGRAEKGDELGPHLGFVMEQTLGHVTHYKNLRNAIDSEHGVRASWYPLSFAPQGALERLPLLRSNWSARASWRAWKMIGNNGAGQQHDAFFFHTQVSALLCAPLMRRVPSVISLDATPINYDSVGSAYGHKRGGIGAETVKHRLNVRSLSTARALVTWCEWACRSLIDDYGIEPVRITVIPPGVNLELWPRSIRPQIEGPVRILFVGADFDRKGGEVLLSAFAGMPDHCELHLVTKTPVAPAPGLYVYEDVEPNSEFLRRLYATADIFVLPTLADCFPLVVQEAMAAGLPVVATDVGAIGEAVLTGETGSLVPSGDARALRDALTMLASDRDQRTRMGARGRVLAEQKFNSAVNAKSILDIKKTVANGSAGYA